MAVKKSTKKAVKKEVKKELNPDSKTIKLQEQPIDCAFETMGIRLVNIQRDLLLPSIAFEHFGVQNTITFFGSARIKSPEVAEANLKNLQGKIKKGQAVSPKLAQAIKEAERDVEMSKYYASAQELATRLQLWINSKNLEADKKPYFMSGGGPGIMEATNRGAFNAGGKSWGLTIYVPDEQRANEYIAEGMHLPFHYFLMRKFWLMFLSKAIVVFPGGSGTLDEFFEVLTLVKTAKIQETFPLILFGSEFWKKVINFDHLIECDVMTKSDLQYFHYVDTVEEAYNLIVPKLEAKLCPPTKKSKK